MALGSFVTVTERGGAGETHVCLEGGEEERIKCAFRRGWRKVRREGGEGCTY